MPAVFEEKVIALEEKGSMYLLQPLGIDAEFLGHLHQLLGGFRILDSLGQAPGSIGLIAVMIGLSHRSTSPGEYGLRKKGSTSVTTEWEPEVRGSLSDWCGGDVAE